MEFGVLPDYLKYGIMRKIVAFLLAFATITSMAAQNATDSPLLDSDVLYDRFRNPDNCYRPFVRWWWNGDKVDTNELKRELVVLKDAGVGGVEINPIAFPEKRCDSMGIVSLRWLDDQWLDALEVTLREAKRLGLQCDLLVGSGWPFGMESVPMDERAQVMLSYVSPVSWTSDDPFVITKQQIFHAVDPKVTDPNSDRLFELVDLFLVPDSVSDVSDRLNLSVPLGDTIFISPLSDKTQASVQNYLLYALVRCTSFASVINGAPGASGPIVDHMNEAAVKRFLLHMSDRLERRLGPMKNWLRTYFVDSMELEGANWTSDMAAEFRRRRGYDLMDWLPFTMFKVGRLGDVVSYEYGAKMSPEFRKQVEQVRYDFELTKAELLHERYTKTFLEWCERQGVQSRAQAYGRGFFPLESSLGYDIPEGESWTTNYLRHKVGEEMGDSDYRRGRSYTMINKYVSSAAHLAGRRLVSAEEMTNTYRIFATSLELLKVGADMSLFSGTTHSVWHGFNYMPQNAGFPGWVQYGSYYNEQNTWWRYFGLLNEYRARLSVLLQHADMVADIAILPPNADLWYRWGVQTEPFPQKQFADYLSLLWEAVHKNGGGADYISETVLNMSSVDDGKIVYGNRRYSVLLLPEIDHIAASSLQKLVLFVKQGGKVICVGGYPAHSVHGPLEDEQVGKLMDQLKKYPKQFILVDKPADGRYLEWYTCLMNQYRLPHSVTIEHPDRFLLHNHYHADDGSDLFFFANSHLDSSICTDVLLPEKLRRGRQVWVYDPHTGNRYRMPVVNGRVRLELSPADSRMLVVNTCKGGDQQPYMPKSGADGKTLYNWHVGLSHAIEGWSRQMVLDSLVDLRETDFSSFAGDVTYTTTLHLNKGENYNFINLGEVADICELYVNGTSCGTRWFGDPVYHIGGLLHEGNNTIVIKVNTLLCNYARTLAGNKVIDHFVIKRNVPSVKAGLIGPVCVYGGVDIVERSRHACRIVDFGAKGDGVALNTKCIQAAIDSMASLGGGTVIVDSGHYVCGTLYLKSGVTLHLDDNAVLKGSTNPWDYVKDPYCRWTAFIFAVKQHDVAITGKGTIDGRGWEVANNMVQYIHLGLCEDPLKYDRPNEGNRPEIIHFRECENVRIQGVTLKNPASWCQQYDQCRHLVIENITVDAKAYWNNDGLDVVDCSEVLVRNCHIDAADDAYCFKSHSVDGVSENVRVENCVGRSSANGIKFGTVTRGAFKNFLFSNITIYDTYRSAVTIASVDGASIENIVVDGLKSLNTGNPIFIRFASRNRAKGDPYIKDILIRNVYAEVPFDKPDRGYNYEGPVEDQPRNISPSSIIGVPGLRVRNVRLENVEINYPGRTDSLYAFRGYDDSTLASIPENEKRYPEFSSWKELPAWGFYMRHADSIVFDNVVMRVDGHDYRPAIVADDVTAFECRNSKWLGSMSSSVPPVVMSMASAKTMLETKAPSSQSANAVADSSRYNASMFGIKSNGSVMNTTSIQKAIDYIYEKGGGTLVFQVGRYLTGSLKMRKGVNIELNEGAILVGSSNPYDYDSLNGEKALIIADRCGLVDIYGLGVVELHCMPLVVVGSDATLHCSAAVRAE